MMEINAIVFVLLLLIALAIGAVVAWFIAFSKGKQQVENKFEQLGKDAKKIIEDAEKEGQAQKRDLIKEAKAEISELKTKADKDIEAKKADLQEESKKLDRRETNLEPSCCAFIHTIFE